MNRPGRAMGKSPSLCNQCVVIIYFFCFTFTSEDFMDKNLSRRWWKVYNNSYSGYMLALTINSAESVQYHNSERFSINNFGYGVYLLREYGHQFNELTYFLGTLEELLNCLSNNSFPKLDRLPSWDVFGL